MEKKISICDRRNALVKRAELGQISPLGFWRGLKKTWAQMNHCDKTTDYCRVDIALDAHSAISRLDMLLR